MAVAVVGALIILIMPGFMALFADQAHLDDQQVGYVAAWEINAMAATIGVSTFLLRRADWRLLVGLALGLICLGNLATACVASYTPLLSARVLAGAGEGIAIGVSFAALGRARNADRVFAIYLVIGAGLSSGLLLVLLKLQSWFGSAPIFVANAVLTGTVGITLYWLDDGRRAASGHQGQGFEIDRRLAIAGLIGVFLYFLAQGEMWSYVEVIGRAHAVSADEISFALAAANIGGVGGAALAGILPRSLGRPWPLLISGAVSFFSFQLLLGAVTASTLAIAAVLLLFAWQFSQPLLSGMCSDADPEGRIVCAMGSIQTVGFGLGPAVAATVLHNQNFAPVIWSSCAFIVASLVVLLAGTPAPLRLRHWPAAGVRQ